MEVDDIKQKLKQIFSFYASFGDRLNIDHLKSSKFKRLMLDTQISKFINQKELDILYFAETLNKQNMTFDMFLNTLTKIASMMFRTEESTVESFHRLLYDHLLPTWEEIIKNPNFQTLFILQNEIQLDELLEYVIRKVGPVLYTIYASYFPWEVTNSKDLQNIKKRSEKAFFDFLTQFDLCPSLLTKTIAFQLWNQIIECENQAYSTISIKICLKKPKGLVYTFPRFVDTLVKLSYLYI